MPRQFVQRIEVLIHFSAREMASRTAALLLLGVAAPPSLALHATRALHVSSCVRPHLRAHPAPQLHGGRRLDDRGPSRGIGAATSLPALLALFAAAPAEAAAPNAIPSALAAYGHYLGLVLVALCLATERLTIKAGMSAEAAFIVAGEAGTSAAAAAAVAGDATTCCACVRDGTGERGGASAPPSVCC